MRRVAGPALDIPPVNVAQMFFATVATHAHEVAFEWLVDGQMQRMTYAEVDKAAREVAGGLIARGIKRGDKVAILAETRADWALADLGIQLAGAVTTTLFTTLAPEQVAFLLEDSGARLLFVGDTQQLHKLVAVPPPANVEAIVLFAPAAQAERDDIKMPTLTLERLREGGRALHVAQPVAIETRANSAAPSDESTIIYTSGTTGVPKGAVLTHQNCVAAAKMPTAAFHLDQHDERRTLVFLPLAHSFTRAIFLNAIDLGARIAFGLPRTLTADLRATRPRLIATAPRIYERIHDQFLTTATQAPALRKMIMMRARDVAIRYGRAVADAGQASPLLAAERAVYDKLVYSKLREKVGLTDLALALSGSAAIRSELLHFFRGAGIVIVEAWGLTETSAPGTTNPLERVRPGTVGLPFPGVEIALDDEGEVLIAGPNVFKGYHARPDENAESFVDIDGRRWFRTGDIGAFDDAGYLRIVDRKKEIEVLDTGKKISPISVEETLKTVSPFVGEACLVGTGRKFAGCLIQPDLDRLVHWAKENGVPFDPTQIVVRPDPTGAPMTYSVGTDILEHPKVQALFAAEVAKCNKKVADHERIRTFRLVPHVFSIDREELTPTLKKKRRVIVTHYKDEIEAMFAKPN